MKARNRFHIRGMMLFMALWVMFGHAPSFGATLVPEGVAVKDAYRPGAGPAVGRITEIEGPAVVIHGDETIGYTVRSAMPVYKNDHLITLSGCRLVVMLNDGSVMKVLPETRLQIHQSAYSSSGRTRSGLIGLVQGKARFWITKLTNFRDSSFQVKTQTAVMGVRGSDFIVTATAKLSEVMTLEDTQLGVRSLAYLDKDPVLMRDYQRSIIPEDGHPAPPTAVAMQEVRRVLQEFDFGREFSAMGAFVGEPSASPSMIVEPPERLVEAGPSLDVDSILRGVVSDAVDAQRKQADEIRNRPLEYFPDRPPVSGPLPDMPGTPE